MVQINETNQIEIRFKFGNNFKNVLQKYLAVQHAGSSVSTIEGAIYLSNLQGFNFILEQMKVINRSLDKTGFAVKMLLLLKIMSLEREFFAASKEISKAVEEESINITALDRFLLYHDVTGLTTTHEEEVNLGKDKSWKDNGKGGSNESLFNLDPQIRRMVDEFRFALNQTNSLDSIKKTLQEKGAELYKYSKSKIQQKNKPYTHKDGILYLARLMMQVIISNHPNIIPRYSSKLTELSKLFEMHSRGLEGTEKPNFSRDSPSFKKVLISGFDPFQGGVDSDLDLSNPSGNIALSLDGRKITNGSKTGIVRSAMFPVRWTDFDDNITEDFFEPYFTKSKGAKPDIIITISYGVHYVNTVEHDYHIERFAANYRGGGTDNNDYNPGDHKLIPSFTDNQKDWTYIETTLPLELLKSTTDDIVKVPNFNAVINHGGFSKNIFGSGGFNPYEGNTGFFYWEIFGTSKATGIEENITSSFTLNQPSNLFPEPFQIFTSANNVNKEIPSFYGNILVADTNKLKYYRKPTSSQPNPSYIPLPTWDNYKDSALEITHDDIRIEARSGSGGSYMSNEIFYRVAFLRENFKLKGNDIPTGHIHIGFNSVDPNTDRTRMLEDIEFIIKQFIGGL